MLYRTDARTPANLGTLPSLVHRHRNPTRRLDEPVIEGQKTQVAEPLSEPDGARQMNDVEAPQSVTFGHLPSPVSDEV
jgi:hypothetical protein